MANYDLTYEGPEVQDILDAGNKLEADGYIFCGVATPSTNPGTPTEKVYYLAKEAGTYTNFGGVTLPAGISMLMWNGTWTSETWYGIDTTPTAGSNNFVKSGDIYSSVPNTVGFPNMREVSNYNNIINGAEAETVRGKIYDSYTEVFGFDKVLYKYTVDGNGQIVQTSSNYSLACIAVKKGDVVRFSASQSGTGNNAAVIPYFSVDYPSEGVSATQFIGLKNIEDGLTINFLLEAPQDGYFVIRHFLRNTVKLVGFKRIDNTVLSTENYIRQELHIPIKGAYGINTDKSSETFGQMISIGGQAYGCSDYIEVSPNDKLYIRKQTTTATGLQNKQVGVCFYDSDKNVIDGITTCYYDLLSYAMFSFIDIPANAKYARLTGWSITDIQGNQTRIYGIYIYKKKGNYDLSLYNDMTKSLLKQAEYTSSPLTIVPSIMDTYNAYYRETFPENMKADGNYMYRLTYFPNYLVGGGELTIKYNGTGLRLFELPYIPLDTSPVNAFKSSEIIRIMYLPNTDSMTEYTLTLSKECKRIAIVWGAGYGTKLNPNNILNYISEITLPVINPSSINIDVSSDIAYPNQYTGETIKFNRTYKSTLFASNSISGQSAAIYGDYLFIPKDRLTSISLYNMKEKNLVYTLNTEYSKGAEWHCNQCQFGIDKYDDSDMFPLLWITVNNDTDGRCAWVGFRIIPAFDEDNNIVSFSITEVQTIHLPVMTDENCLGNVNIAVDYDNKCFWGYGRNNNSEASNYQKAHFAKFQIPALFDNGVLVPEVTYNDEDILEQFSDDWSMVYAQGGFIKDGRLYIMQGYSSVNLINLRVIDLYIAKKQVSYVNLLANGFTQEPEGVFFYEDTLFTATNNSNIHRFDFS